MTNTATHGATHRRPRLARSHDPLLTSKITVPDMPDWIVSRPRIERRIAEGARGPLTLVTGPPGAGKTMAIASWAADYSPGPVAWVTLDEYDNSPRTFWSYVVAALSQAGVPVSRAASALAHGEATGYVFLLRLASALAANEPPVVLVLDDLHLVTEPTTLARLDYVLRNARSGLRLVVASRMDPLLPLHQYRLTGDLTEVRAADLAFSVPEAALLMAQHGITLRPESLELITARAEGWAAGLRMAAISMDGHPEPEQFAKNFAAEDSAVAGYLMEEVLNTQPADLRDLLLCTSVLDRVNAGIAGELVGDEYAGSVLGTLAKENAFVQPVERDWYRYHSLFRSVLRLKLRREQPDRVAELHRRAARWYQRNGTLRDAVRHAGEADDWQLAAAILVEELAVAQLIEPHSGRLPTEGFRRVPEGTAQPQRLLAAAAVALSEARDQTGGALLAAAEKILGQLSDDQEVPSRFGTAMMRLALARRSGDLDTAAAAAARAQKMLERTPERPRVRHPEAWAQVLSGRGVVELWSGNFDEAARLLDRAAHILGSVTPATPDTGYELATSQGYLALLEALRGRLSRAAELAGASTVVPGDAGAGQPSPPAAAALAFVHLERNELNGSRADLKLADAALRAHPDKLISAIACLVAARRSLAEGRGRAAVETVRRARSGWSPPGWLEHMLTVTESQACAAAGDVQAAVETAGRAGPEAALDATVALTRAWLAAGNLRAARQSLARAEEAATDKTPERIRLDALLADALVSFRSGDQIRGRQSLERALQLGEPQRFRLPFAMERSWIRPTLARHPDIAAAHRDLLEPGLVPPGRIAARPGTISQPAPMIVEQLTDREREVLRRVADMDSTVEIAAELYISVNTVKTHLKSIFRKLAAADRRQAVRRARQLRLILFALSGRQRLRFHTNREDAASRPSSSRLTMWSAKSCNRSSSPQNSASSRTDTTTHVPPC